MTGTPSTTRTPAPLHPGQLVEETRTGRIIRLTEQWTTSLNGWFGTHKGEHVAVHTRDLLPVEESTLQHLLRAKAGATSLGEHGIAAEIANVLEHAAGRVRQAVDGPDEPHIVRGDQ